MIKLWFDYIDFFKKYEQVLRSYKLAPGNDEEVGMKLRMNRIPDKPINIKFEKCAQMLLT